MNSHYHEYLINTDSVSRTKEEIRDHLNKSASILLTISGYENGETVTQEVTFVPEEVPTTGFIFSRGMIQPENTEASIVEEDNKYLVLVAALDQDQED